MSEGCCFLSSCSHERRVVEHDKQGGSNDASVIISEWRCDGAKKDEVDALGGAIDRDNSRQHLTWR